MMGKYSQAAIDRAQIVARRQAFGAGFDPKPSDVTTVESLTHGRVVLPPHPEWTFEGDVDWGIDPFQQRNWSAQLHMLRWLDPIRRQASLGHTQAMGVWERHARSWVAQNPPGSASSRWAWSDMVDAVRAQTLLLGLPYISQPEWLLGALEQHGEWLLDPQNLGHSNHALHQHSALMMLGSSLDRPSWTTLALDRLEAHFASAYDAEGVNAEGAPGYWALNYSWSRQLAVRLEREGLEVANLSQAISKARLTIAHATRPDGLLEAIGDTGPQRTTTDGSPELEYVTTRGGAGSPPAETARIYSGGYAFGRSGWGETDRRMVDESFYSLMFGRADKVHGHKDGGSLTFFSNGRPLLVDAGKFAYTSGPMRDYVLNRLGHNVVHVRGARYDPKSNVTLVRHQLTDSYDNYVLRDTGYSGVVIERQVVFARASETILCVDTVRADRDVEVECRWHLNPEASVRAEQGKVRARIKGADFSIVWGGTLPEVEVVKGHDNPFEGWVSPKWNESVPAPLVKAVQRGRRFRIVTALCPSAEPGPRLSSIDVGGGRRGFVVHGRGVSEVITLDGGEVAVGPHMQNRQAGSVAMPREAVAPRSAEIVELEDENRAARALLWSDPAREDVQATVATLAARLERGVDYGSSAILRDLNVKFEGVVGDELIDSRTRPGLPMSSSGEVFDYFGKSLSTFAHPHVPPTIDFGTGESVHLIEVGGLLLPIRIRAGEGRTLVVAFSGALDRSRAKLPRFERMRSLSTLGTPVAVVSDPTLDLSQSLPLAWYLGTRSVDLHRTLADVIEKLRKGSGCERIVLFGTSGGGFAALQVASHLGVGATAIAVNPQTDIRQYHKRFSSVAIDRVFGAGSRDGELFDQRLSALSRYAASTSRPEIVYVSNRGDEHHVSQHARPFLGLLRSERPEIRVDEIEVDWGQGHVGPSAEFFNELLSSVVGRADLVPGGR